MKSVFLLATLALTACGGPSFSNPTCTKAYNTCLNVCEDKCSEHHGGRYSLTKPDDELKFACNDCVDGCKAEGKRCDAPTP